MPKTWRQYSLLPFLVALIVAWIFVAYSTGAQEQFAAYGFPIFGSFWQHIGVMAFGLMQNIAFTFVSRTRNRDKDLPHIVSAICSNGFWYLTTSSVFFLSFLGGEGAQAGSIPYHFLMPYLLGFASGSLIATEICKPLESFLGSKADATAQEKENEKKTILQLVRDQIEQLLEHWFVFGALAVIGIVSLFWSASWRVALVLLVVAFGQNICFAMSGRAMSRNSRLYLAGMTIVSALVFYFVFKTLIAGGMPVDLIVPYTIGTALGSVMGARISMIIEKIFILRPDEHTKKEKKSENKEQIIRWGDVALWSGLFMVGATIIFFTPYPMASAGFFLLLVFFEKATYALVHRASNRDHFNYHLVARFINGGAYFVYSGFMVVSGAPIELATSFVLGTALGHLFGQRVGIFIESKLEAVMDIPPLPKRKSA